MITLHDDVVVHPIKPESFALYQEAIDQLDLIATKRHNEIKSFREWFGLCQNVFNYGIELEHVRAAFTTWESYSGNECFPVPKSKDNFGHVSARNMFTRTNNYYADNEYGDLRRSLAKHSKRILQQILKASRNSLPVRTNQ